MITKLFIVLNIDVVVYVVFVRHCYIVPLFYLKFRVEPIHADNLIFSLSEIKRN